MVVHINVWAAGMHLWNASCYLVVLHAELTVCDACRMRSNSRLGADAQADSSSARVTAGGAAPTPPSEPFSPASMAASHPRISDAGTAVTVGTLGTDAGSRQEADEAELLLLQAQSPVASAKGVAAGTDSPSSLQEEHWFDARYSHSQQESPDSSSASPLSRQQQQAEQQLPWLETLKQQAGSQQPAKQQQQQRQRPSSFSSAYQAAAAAAGEPPQQHARSFTGTGKQQQQQQPSPGGVQSAAGASKDAAAAAEARMLGIRASQLIEEELADTPARSGGSASSALSGPQDSSRQLKSMRSL
jgi:hypothetical protein